MNLLNNHTSPDDKIGCGISHFRKSTSKSGGSHLELFRIDGSTDSLSWLTCCGRRVSYKEYITQVCRTTLVPLIDEFRLGKTCELCDASSNLHVHHSTMSFHTMFENWLNNHNDELLLKRNTETGLHTFADIAIANDWLKYHNANCKLQVLCDACHQYVHTGKRTTPLSFIKHPHKKALP